jgi:phosphatidylserine decarboxylase
MAIKTEYVRVAPQGRLIVALAVVAAFVVAVVAGAAWSIPLWLLALGLLYALRDPVRVTPSVPMAVVSPVDGRIISVGATTDYYVQRQAYRIRMRMSRRGAYVIRSPMEGKVVEQWFTAQTGAGAKEAAHPADQGKSGSKQAPRCRCAWIRTDEDDDITLAIYPRCLFCSPHFDFAAGGRVGHGQRCGFLLGGGVIVDVFVPATSRLDCSAGDRVMAGSDIIATLIHK